MAGGDQGNRPAPDLLNRSGTTALEAARLLGAVEALAAAIRRCQAGEDVVDPSLAAQALRAAPSPLSSTEREILAACAEGLPTEGIARRVWLSEGTVRNKVSEILGKLGARNRTEAVQIARENGWL